MTAFKVDWAVQVDAYSMVPGCVSRGFRIFSTKEKATAFSIDLRSAAILLDLEPNTPITVTQIELD